MSKEREELCKLNDDIFYNKIAPLIPNKYYLESRIWYKLNYHIESLMFAAPTFEESQRLDSIMKPLMKDIENKYGLRLYDD